MPNQNFIKSLLKDCFTAFFILFLPLLASYKLVINLQQTQFKSYKQQVLSEISEITAHLTRLGTPEVYFNNLLKTTARAFKWASDTSDISFNGNLDSISIYLFDQSGKRIPWQHGTKGKKRVSQEYLKILKKIDQSNKSFSLSKRDLSIAKTFSGNSNTIYQMVKQKNTLCSFDKLGLKKFGAWFKVQFSNKETGDLIAWIDKEKVCKHKLAQKAIDKIFSFIGKPYQFAWIDLSNPAFNGTIKGKKLSDYGLELLSNNKLKSIFSLEENLYSIADTQEGIRLICSRPPPATPSILETYFSFLVILIPAILLIILWKNFFNVDFSISVTSQFSLIFGITALLGLTALIGGATIFQTEKQKSLNADFKNQGIEILKRIDNDFSAYYGDLLRQYNHFSHLLTEEQQTPNQILAPLLKAQKEEKIEYALYRDSQERTLFRAPTSINKLQNSIAGKYNGIMKTVSDQIIKKFNASKAINPNKKTDPTGTSAIIDKPVEGLLAHRSTLQNLIFSGDETLTYMNMAFAKNEIAKGCLIIIHNPAKMQNEYLTHAGKDLAKTTGYTLAAFPQKLAPRRSFFPRYSIFNNPTVWKLHDLVNQTQVACFKTGRVDSVMSLIIGIPGNNLKKFNLFLIIPLAKITQKAKGIAGFFVFAGLIVLIFISFLCYYTARYLLAPILSINKLTPDFTENRISTNLDSVLKNISDIFSISNYFKNSTPKDIPLASKDASINLNNSIYSYKIVNQSDCFEDQIIFQLASKKLLLGSYRLKKPEYINGISLATIKMALKVLSNNERLVSAKDFLTALEEHFRITLRKDFPAEISLCIIDNSNKIKSFACTGNALGIQIYEDGNNNILRPFTETLTMQSLTKLQSQPVKFSQKGFFIIPSPGLALNNRSDLLHPLLRRLSEISFSANNSENVEIIKEAIYSCFSRESNSTNTFFIICNQEISQ